MPVGTHYYPGQVIYVTDLSDDIGLTRVKPTSCPECKSDRLYIDSGNCRDCNWTND